MLFKIDGELLQAFFIAELTYEVAHCVPGVLLDKLLMFGSFVILGLAELLYGFVYVWFLKSLTHDPYSLKGWLYYFLICPLSSSESSEISIYSHFWAFVGLS